ncbi:MAG: trypsin-like peptidase domain-containing protein [Verrucomicrobiae bacterium]
MALILFVLLAVLLIQLSGKDKAPTSRAATAAPQPVQNIPLPPPASLSLEESNHIAIYQRVSPSVVSVANNALRRAGLFGFQVYEVPQGAGSGFVWDRQGHIVSNYHVIHEADALSVTLTDGKSYDAQIVGVAPDYDLAVLKIDAPEPQLHPIHPIHPGTSRDLQVGQTVLAIGNPFGLDTSLSKGIISALNRSITAMTGQKIDAVIQTDAAINPGNSGGPLLDSSGRLIGVNTAILSPSGTYAGVGFAMPVDTVMRIVPQLIQKGHVSRAGLDAQLLPDYVTQRAGITGVAVFAVPPTSAAAAAGITGITRTPSGDLVLGDVIIAIGAQPVTCLDDLRAALERFQPGENVRVQLERNGQKRALSVKLAEVQ